MNLRDESCPEVLPEQSESAGKDSIVEKDITGNRYNQIGPMPTTSAAAAASQSQPTLGRSVASAGAFAVAADLALATRNRATRSRGKGRGRRGGTLLRATAEMKILESAASTVTLDDLIAGWLRRHRRPRDTFFHVQASLDDFGVAVPDEVLRQIYDESRTHLNPRET